RHQSLYGRVEHGRHFVEADATGGQHPAKKLRQIVMLADSRREVEDCGIDPLSPSQTTYGALDAKECRSLTVGQREFCQSPHSIPLSNQERRLAWELGRGEALGGCTCG